MSFVDALFMCLLQNFNVCSSLAFVFFAETINIFVGKTFLLVLGSVKAKYA
jgi:hypothetical protein